MLPAGKRIEIVEIKKPTHKLDDGEYQRLFDYKVGVENFLKGNPEYASLFSHAHMTLICDAVNLSSALKDSYTSSIARNELQHKTWEELLLNTRLMHEDFIKARDEFLRKSSTAL